MGQIINMLDEWQTSLRSGENEYIKTWTNSCTTLFGKMNEDKGNASYDKNGRRLVGMTAKASGPVGQDKKQENPTGDREGRQNFIEGKTHPDDKGTTNDTKPQ